MLQQKKGRDHTKQPERKTCSSRSSSLRKGKAAHANQFKLKQSPSSTSSLNTRTPVFKFLVTQLRLALLTSIPCKRTIHRSSNQGCGNGKFQSYTPCNLTTHPRSPTSATTPRPAVLDLDRKRTVCLALHDFGRRAQPRQDTGVELRSRGASQSLTLTTMRLHRAPPSALVGLLLASLAAANPYPRDHLRDVGFGYLMDRSCASYCGTDNQYCCGSDEACVTSNNIAACTNAVAAGTTTWTVTYTSTWSSYIAGATTPASSGSNGEDCVPPDGSGQIACGTICCANWQYCAYSDQCSANSGVGTWTTGTTTVGVVTTAFSAPYRVTGTGTGTTTTATGTAASVTATSTGGAGGAVATTTNNGLSGGAIAGIVVGTIAGIILLLLLCFCCIVRGLWHTVMAIFGIGKNDKRKTERTEIIEERYSRHGSAHPSAAAARPAHRTWFGGGGGRPSQAGSRKEKKSGGAGWLAAAGGAALLLLGLKRGDKHKEGSHKPPRTDWSSSYYTDSYTASSPSKSSITPKLLFCDS